MMDYVQAAAWLLTRDHFLILTHKRPDGDTTGCAAGLCRALREQGKTAYILENVQATSLFTPHFEGLLSPADYTPQTVVAVDIAAAQLIPNNATCYLESGIHLTIDHHPSQEFFAQDTCLDGSRAACGELVYDIVRQWGKLSPEVALPLYLAVSTDTGCFVYGNTTANTHHVVGALMDTGISVQEINHRHFRMKSFVRLKLEGILVAEMERHNNDSLAVVSLSLAQREMLGITEEDLDNISSLATSIEGVTIGATLQELRPDVWKLSLRSHLPDVNASTICALMGGGGHAAASGATINGSLDEVKSIVLDSIRRVQHG